VEQPSVDTNGTSTNGKRKAEDDGEEESVKKVKFDEVAVSSLFFPNILYKGGYLGTSQTDCNTACSGT
jgi:hypothetical protein